MFTETDKATSRGGRRHHSPGGRVAERARVCSQRGIPSRKLPVVILAERLLPLIGAFIQREVGRLGEHIETGGMLVGEFHADERPPVFRLTGFVEAGPRAEKCAESVLFDHEFQASMLDRIRAEQPQVGNMGCLHLHPGQLDECSAGDQATDREAVAASDTRALVFAIVTLNNRARDPLSLYYGNLKFDFFLMGEQTGFEYVHVRPQVGAARIGKSPRAHERLGRRHPNGRVKLSCHYSRLPGVLGDKRRLVAEVRAMEERYGDRAVLRYQRNLLLWEYTVVESGRRFPVEIRYPRRYPLEPPRIISRLPLPPSPHQLVGHELCWIDRSAMGDWNPARDTAATCVASAHRWFACLLVYLTLGAWPEEANDAPAHAL
jgi:hypothetical protein